MLSHSGSLGLAHHLLNVEPLPFSCIITEDFELMKLKTVLEGHPRLQTPPFGHLTVYSSPQVTLLHLAANTIPLELWIPGHEVSKQLVDFGNHLVMSLLEILKQLLGLLNIPLSGCDINVRQDCVP